jgi:hypothetical protein
MVFSGRSPQAALEKFYIPAYKTWSDTWKDAFRELDGNDTLFSDDFTRQHEIGALFHNEDCIALSFFNPQDFRLETSRLDSYFKPWTELIFQKFLNQGEWDCLVSSYFTVHKDWRKSQENISVKDILSGLAIERFLLTNHHFMVGTLRNNRGMNELGYRFGAEPIMKNLKHHGVEVDVVSFYRDKVHTDHDAKIYECIAAAMENGNLSQQWSNRKKQKQTA